MRVVIKGLSGAIFSLIGSTAHAECNLSEVVGYTVFAEKYVKGFVKDGVFKEEFDGCDFETAIVFDDGTGVKCSGYRYHYAYHPRAYLFANANSIKACIDGDIYSVEQIR